MAGGSRRRWSGLQSCATDEVVADGGSAGVSLRNTAKRSKREVNECVLLAPAENHHSNDRDTARTKYGWPPPEKLGWKPCKETGKAGLGERTGHEEIKRKWEKKQQISKRISGPR